MIHLFQLLLVGFMNIVLRLLSDSCKFLLVGVASLLLNVSQFFFYLLQNYHQFSIDKYEYLLYF